MQDLTPSTEQPLAKPDARAPAARRRDRVGRDLPGWEGRAEADPARLAPREVFRLLRGRVRRGRTLRASGGRPTRRVLRDRARLLWLASNSFASCPGAARARPLGATADPSESRRAGVRSCVATQDESFAGNVSMQDLTPSTEQPLAREGLPREPRGSPVLLEGGARLDGEAVDLPELLPEVPQVRP
jgi:hypothetical protein